MILGQSHIQESERIVSKAVDAKEQDSKIRKKFNNFPMNGILFYISVELSPLRKKNFIPGQAMVDCECSSYTIINLEYAKRYNLKCLQTSPIHISTFEGDLQQETIEEVAYRTMQIRHHVQQEVFFFVVKLEE